MKKKDPGCPTITCLIGAQHFSNALCDLGASVSVMPKLVYDKLNHNALAPIAMCLQLADQTVRYPAGIVENILVKIQNFFIPVDFVVLNLEVDAKMPLILGRPFLSTANADIDVGAVRSSSTPMASRRSSHSNRRSNNATKSKRSEGRRNPRKRRRNHRSQTLKPSSHLWRIYGSRRSYDFKRKRSKSSFTIRGMPNVESSIRNFWNHRK